MMLDKNARQLAQDIERLIRDENYASAQELLPQFADAVVQACNHGDSASQFLAAKAFLQSAVVAVKAHQAQYLVQLTGIRRERAYRSTETDVVTHTVDVAG